MSTRTLERLVLALTLVLALFSVTLAPAGANIDEYIVDTGNDGDASGCSDATPLDCTLRGAITRANDHPGAVIRFAVSEVAPAAPLPPITAAGVTIRGEPGARVNINGKLMTTGPIFDIRADRVAIQYLAIFSGPVGGSSADIEISNGSGIEISHNDIGVPPGVLCGTPGIRQWSQYGIYVSADLSGGPGAGNGVAYIGDNTIACHGSHAIYATKANYLYVGYAPDGANAPNTIVQNSGDGIRFDVVVHSTIGNNAILGNGLCGVSLVDSFDTWVRNNRIGHKPDLPLQPNGLHGVRITGSSGYDVQGNVVGGPSEHDGNVISGNQGYGVMVEGGAGANAINNNTIGRLEMFPGGPTNDMGGVAIVNGANDNLIGSAAGGAYQIIAGNGGPGIAIHNASNTMIGYSTVIYLNAEQGIVVLDSGGGATGNLFSPAMVAGNGGIPIDLGGDGPTKNGTHSGPGPNNWIEYPVMTSYVPGVSVGGSACPGCSVLLYLAYGDPAQPGGGGMPLVRVVTAGGDGQWTATAEGSWTPPSPAQLSVVACDGANNCSEMSPRPQRWLPVQNKNWLPEPR